MKRAASVRAAALAILFGALAACGQRGPLTLPDSARPIERLPAASAPAAGSPGENAPDESADGAKRNEPGRRNER